MLKYFITSLFILAIGSLQPAFSAPVESQISARGLSNQGIIAHESQYSVKETSERAVKILKSQGFTVFNVIDHQKNAQNIGKTILPTQLILFGNPKIGSHLLMKNPSIGLDLPQKFLIWETPSKEVYIAYNDPYVVARRHAISRENEILKLMNQGLYKLAKAIGN